MRTEKHATSQTKPDLPDIVNLHPDGIIVLDRDFRVIFLNPSASNMIGQSLGEAIGKTLWEIATHFFSRDIYDVLQESLSSQMPVHFEDRCGGGTSWCEFYSIPEQNTLTLIIKEITDRKLTQESLERLAAFTKRSPFPVVQTDREGRIILKNDAFSRLVRDLKIEEQQLLPENFPSLAKACLQKGQMLMNIESKVRERTFLWAIVPSDDSSVVQGYATEITERLQLEEQIRQNQKMESLGRLAGGIAHDFNNYLTVIQGYSQLLQLEPELSEEARVYLNEIFQTSEKAARLTSQILTFSRRQVVRPKPIYLGEMVLKFVEFLRPLLGESITIHFMEDANLPPIIADENMVEQIIMNLATNAKDAMPDGGTLTISLSCVSLTANDRVVRSANIKHGRFVCITVSDQGAGMDKDTLKKIFEPFFTTKDIGRGTGLGLSVVDSIVKQLNGWIDVESQPGQGTSFMVYLPSSEANVQHNLQSPTKTDDSVLSGKGETILVVDDQVNLLQLVEKTLTKNGYTVLSASTGAEALGLWRKNKDKINLVVTDIMMPGGISGLDLANRISSEKQSVPVIFMSGYSVDLMAIKDEHRLDLLLQKPFHPEDLLKMVSKVLHKLSYKG